MKGRDTGRGAADRELSDVRNKDSRVANMGLKLRICRRKYEETIPQEMLMDIPPDSSS